MSKQALLNRKAKLEAEYALYDRERAQSPWADDRAHAGLKCVDIEDKLDEVYNKLEALGVKL